MAAAVADVQALTGRHAKAVRGEPVEFRVWLAAAFLA
jgi:hypothetical protein